MRISALALSGSLLAGLLLASCAPVVSQRGYLPDAAGEASIRVGVDTKATIQQRLGDPSTQATFTGDAWYYISSTEKQVAFFDPKVENRAILAIHFDKDGKVTELKHYALRDGHVIAFESRITPTRGHDVTFLEQVLGSTPGVPVGQDTENSNPGGGSHVP
jgi:outer membrane protein assembly factor BamE (lipoprotein component of BamABCDE complex)